MEQKERKGAEIKLQFKCQQCGLCCTKYGRGLTASAQDIVRWRREDILARVRVFESGRVIKGGDLWLNPRTGRKMDCPFLKKRGEKFHCSIHSTKPEVCRKYPFTGVGVELGGCKGIKILR